MIKGIGVDIVEIARIPLNDAFITKILSIDELSVYNTFSNNKRKREYVAGRFAGKEALVKALSDKSITFSKVSILNDENGKPFFKDRNTMISISHENDYVIAYVLEQ